jgi:hypothetical protein
MPHIFYIDIYFIFLRESKLAIFRLLRNHFHVIQNSKQASSTVVQTSLNIAYVCDDELLLFKQAYLMWHSNLCGGNNSMTSSFFVIRWLSIFWITNGCTLDTFLCLTQG